MIRNQNIICISSIDWDFSWQVHQEMMSTFAKNGNRVLYIENTGIRTPSFKDTGRVIKRCLNWLRSVHGFRRENDNLYIYSPIILPFPFSTFISKINHYLMISQLKRWMNLMQFHDPIIWTFLPNRIALDVATSIKNKLFIYYYIADFDQLVRDRLKLKTVEEKLIKQCDLIFVQSEEFKNKCIEWNSHVFIYPAGVNVSIFNNEKESFFPVPQDLRHIPKPIIGYIGGIHRHMDFDLIQSLAQKNPEWSFVLVGPVQTDIDKIKNGKNVYLTGKKDFSQLPYYVNQFSVGFVPYVVSDYTKTVLPTKINEYHALGKPVISSCLPQVIKSNDTHLIYMAKDHDDFEIQVKNALRQDSHELKKRRIQHAKAHSWDIRLEQMSIHISDALERKENHAISLWQIKLFEAYRNSRRKLIGAVAMITCIWVLVFYTPLIWVLADPLKFSDPLEKADAIVVFAGGVGENGLAGQSYAERVSYAVELYQKGYAPYLLFSSGSRGTYFETYIMKTLAISLGVPSSHIIEEDKAASTFQNVTYTHAILEQKKWKKIILISTPYHMLRTSLVCEKWMPQKKIIYTPLLNTSFFKRAQKWKKITFMQVRALLHEYVAILYYMWKGYI